MTYRTTFMPVCFCLDEEHRVLSFESVHYICCHRSAACRTCQRSPRLAPRPTAGPCLLHSFDSVHRSVPHEQSFRAAVRGELYAVPLAPAAVCCTVLQKSDVQLT